MKRYRTRIGDPPPLRAAALTLLLAAVVICTALLGVLCLATARADYRLAQRQLQTLQKNAAADTAAASWQAQTETALKNNTHMPEDTALDDDELVAVLSLEDGGTLRITACVENGTSVRIINYRQEYDWEPDEGWNIWDGE